MKSRIKEAEEPSRRARSSKGEESQRSSPRKMRGNHRTMRKTALYKLKSSKQIVSNHQKSGKMRRRLGRMNGKETSFFKLLILLKMMSSCIKTISEV
jgi:hypothetical protein